MNPSQQGVFVTYSYEAGQMVSLNAVTIFNEKAELPWVQCTCTCNLQCTCCTMYKHIDHHVYGYFTQIISSTSKLTQYTDTYSLHVHVYTCAYKCT